MVTGIAVNSLVDFELESSGQNSELNSAQNSVEYSYRNSNTDLSLENIGNNPGNYLWENLEYSKDQTYAILLST